ncbi:MAG: hypothetical protein M1833_000564 [Piccolia ochrophora]|nr:MAG: hypothetical protein M1833_000564 [Piccolia ochrophora]
MPRKSPLSAKPHVPSPTTTTPTTSNAKRAVSSALSRSPSLPNARTIPQPLRFPVLVLASLALSSLFYSLAAPYTGGELASVSRSLNSWWEVGGLVGWRAVELSIGWWLEYDGIDLASLTLLSHLPTLYLLSTFYGVSSPTIIISLTIDILTTSLPFRLFRPLSPAHHASTSPTVPNRSIIADTPLSLTTTLLATAIYAITLYTSLTTFLPTHLVTYFTGLRSLSAAYAPALPVLVLNLLPAGYAAREYLFTATAGFAQSASKPRASSPFNPATASLRETLAWNVWGYAPRSKFLLKRTATLMLVTGLNTWVHTYVTVDGVESAGAAGWSGVWVVAAGLTGGVFWWVGDV